MIMYEGPSAMDGSPIVAIATWGTRNAKTGPMIQVWILPRYMSPTAAVKSGADTSVCGHCPLRGNGNAGRACYVLVHNAPQSVHGKYTRGGYEPAKLASFAGTRIRWGAYGDPAMLPASLVRRYNRVAHSHTGYTHQWKHGFAKWTKGVFMASAETASQVTDARSQGWGVFYVSPKRPKGASHCMAERTGATCHECGQCDGRNKLIWIEPHGFGSKNLYTLRKRAA